MQNPKLVQIKTGDGIILPGLLYEAPRSKKVAIHLHGNGSSSVFYYDDRQDEQVKALNKKGISFLLFNNRGAHYIKKLNVIKRGKKERKRFGMAYEKIKDCIKDIDGAISYLGKLGYRKFYLIGESTGANKICVYHYYKPKNKVSKYVLLSGGDDTGIYYDMLGKKRFFKSLKESKKKIRKKKGEEIITELLPDDIFSYIGFYDIANPDGDYNVFPFLETMKNLKLSKKSLFRHFKSINKSTLIVYGEKDEYAWGDVPKIVDILRKQKPEFEYKIIKGADHGFSENQKELSRIISNWLDLD
jgi:pimeloyl-ACP methyl ester carboxylesterase